MQMESSMELAPSHPGPAQESGPTIPALLTSLESLLAVDGGYEVEWQLGGWLAPAP